MARTILVAMIIVWGLIVAGIARADVSTCTVDAHGNLVGCTAPAPAPSTPVHAPKGQIKVVK